MKNVNLTFLLLLTLASSHAYAQTPEKVADIPNYAFNGYYPYSSAGNNTNYYNSSYYNTTNANFTVAGNLLFFTVYDTSAGYQLWVTDGSSTGTTMIQVVAAPGQSFSFSNFTVFNNQLYFIGTTQQGSELWVSDGTTKGTQKLTSLNRNSYQFLIIFNNQLYLLGSEPNAGYHLFAVNSDSIPLQPLVDLSSLGIINALLFNNKIYFTSADSAGQYLWLTDGTESGTNVILLVPYDNALPFDPIGFSDNINVDLVVCNRKLWFFTEETLWVSDSTSGGITMVPNSNYYDLMDADFAELENVAIAGDNIYYVLAGENEPGDCGVHPPVLVVCNGDSSQVLLNSTWLNLFSSGWAALNGNLYFPYNQKNSSNKNQLWSSDGTVRGTTMVDTLLYNPATNYTLSTFCYLTNPQNTVCGFTAINNKLYFISADGNNNGEVWIYDAGLDTTEEIIPPTAANCSPLWYNSSFVEYKDAVYYLASYNTPGQELWRINQSVPGDSVMIYPDFSLYPNPAHSSINITSPGVDQVFIYNLQGEIVKTQNINPTDVIDISAFSNGAYLIRNAGNTFKAKFVKD